MIDLNKCEGWQIRDPETGLVFPWYTKEALDEICTWDLKGKTVYEFGCGQSTLWWKAKGCDVSGVESDEGYYKALSNIGCDITYRTDAGQYSCDIYEHYKTFDIIIIDGIYRDECVEHALECLQMPEGRLIIDNWKQPSVWMPNQKTIDLLSVDRLFAYLIYKQPGHPDWQTAIFSKNPYPLRKVII